MAYSLTVAGYTFENPPEEYRKLARVGNSPQTSFNKQATAFYQSDTQDLQFQAEGTLALDPAVGGTDDLAELERLQEIAITGGEVQVEFDPFFSGKAVIEDDPFRQDDGESSYQFTFTVNSEDTDSSAYPSHSSPDTGNTFELGDLDLGYDPNTVQQNYERQTEKVKRLQGIARSVDTEGLIPKVKMSGLIDGGGQATLWDKARSNVMAFLSAEFQNGWCLIDTLSIRNAPEAPDYLTGMFRYDLDLLVVADPASGIGEVSKFVDRKVRDQTTYVSNCDEDGVFERLGDDSESYPDALDYRISGGTGKLDGSYVEWQEHFDTLDQSTTNYIWAEDPDGDGYGSVNTGTSGFPGNTVPLYEVDTGTSSVNDIRDQRTCLMGTRLEFEDDEVGDLNLLDGLSLDDSSVLFEPTVRFSDALSITETGLLPATGIASFTDSLAVTEANLLPALGLADFTETASLQDGGSATGGGSGSTPELTATCTLNGGSVDVTVHEDTDQDGTAENTETVTLQDGTNTYTLNNLSGEDNADYWLDFTITSGSDTTTPTVDSASLDNGVSGADEDQNPNTTWQITPGQHDTSGNEYEGGGVVATYEG